jgi:hypothetical protein
MSGRYIDEMSSNGATGLMIISVIIYAAARYQFSKGESAPKTTYAKLFPKFAYILITYLAVCVTMSAAVAANCAQDTSFLSSVSSDGSARLVFPLMLFFFVIPMAVLVLLLDGFDGWLSPFSNTFGYGVASFVMGDDISGTLKKNTAAGDIDSSVGRLYQNPTVFMNALTLDDLEDQGWNGYVKKIFFPGGEGDTTEPIRDQLRQFILLKDLIAESVWFVLLGSTCIAAGENTAYKYSCG